MVRRTWIFDARGLLGGCVLCVEAGPVSSRSWALTLPGGVVWVFALSTGVGPPGTKVRTLLPGSFGLAVRPGFVDRPVGPYVRWTQGSRGKGRCRRPRVLGPVRPSGQVFGGSVLWFALRWGLHGRGKWFSTSYVPARSVGSFRGRSQVSVIGCSLGERPNNAHSTLSVTPNFFSGANGGRGVIDGGGQAMGRTVWKVEGFLENYGFVHHEANTIQVFSCSLVVHGDVGPLVATHTHRPLGFPGTSRNRWRCFRTKVLVFPDTPPLLPSGCTPTGSTPWKRSAEALLQDSVQPKTRQRTNR